MYRGQTKDGKWVKGSLWVKKRANTSWNKHYIWILDGKWCEVIPESIAQFTGILDKNKTEIYGSIPIDGKMSRGGDVLLNDEDAECMPGEKFDVKYLPGHFVAGGILGAGDHIGEDCQVIGNQMEKEK